MPRQITVYRCLVISPGDVKSARDAFSQIASLIRHQWHQSEGPMTSKPRVFLINHSDDSRAAYALSKALVQRGFWLADSSVPEVHEESDSELSRKIQIRLYNELRDASVVLLLLSSRSSESKWVRQEIAAAQSMGQPLVVVLAPGYSGSIPLEVTESADVITKWNAGSVADSIGQLLAHAA